jgi:hypothetical protein
VLSISSLGSNQPKLDDHDHLEFASLHGTMHQGGGIHGALGVSGGSGSALGFFT